MTQPAQYSPVTDFSQDEANNIAGRSSVRTVQLDAEFASLATTLGQILTNLGILQRDDTALHDNIVTQASLSSTVLALFTAIGVTPRGAWLTTTAYAVKDIVETGAPLIPYMCVTAHTSGTFATDKAAGKWVALGGATPNASQITSTASGDVAATNVDSAIAELASEKMAKANNLGDVQDLATAQGNLFVFSKIQVQTSSSIVAAAGGTFDAITASYTPSIATLSDKMVFYVVAGGANTVTNPTFTPNSGVIPAKTIKKGAIAPLVVNDIPGAGYVMILAWSAANDCWLFLNPAAGASITGSFTGTLTGYAASPTGTINYSKSGTFVTLWASSAINGVSNATTLTMTGVPANLRPTSAKKVPTKVVDNGNVADAIAQVGTAGTITFNNGSDVGNAWTAAGTKGVYAQWSLTYNLD
jgi:hypothetical protein